MAKNKLQGGCQCGAVRYEAALDLTQPALECNCSRCGKAGFALQFVPAEEFTQTAGEGATTEYRFHTGNIKHEFCTTCGIQAFGSGTGPDGVTMVAVNVRTVDDVNMAQVPRTQMDGKAR